MNTYKFIPQARCARRIKFTRLYSYPHTIKHFGVYGGNVPRILSSIEKSDHLHAVAALSPRKESRVLHYVGGLVKCSVGWKESYRLSLEPNTGQSVWRQLLQCFSYHHRYSHGRSLSVSM